MTRHKQSRAVRIVNALSVALLGVAVLIVFLRFAPPTARDRMVNLSLYAAGRADGCGLAEVLSPLEHDLQLEGQQLLPSVRRVAVTPDGLARWETPQGEIWAPEGNDVLFMLAEQNLDVYHKDEVAVRPGDVVLDCGANIGGFTRRALNAGASLVVAVEPSPRNVACLRRNFAKEIEEGRVVVVPKGVWDERGSLNFQVYDNSLLDSLVMKNRPETQASASEIEVDLVTIDELVTELQLSRVDFVKMDIEGAERNALKGAIETLRRFQPALAIATENLPDDIHVLPQIIHDAVPGYRQTNGRCLRIQPTMIRPEVIYFQVDRPS